MVDGEVRLGRRRAGPSVFGGSSADAMVRYPVRSAPRDLATVRRAVAGLLRGAGPLAGPGARPDRPGDALGRAGPDDRPARADSTRVDPPDLRRLDDPGLPD